MGALNAPLSPDLTLPDRMGSSRCALHKFDHKRNGNG